MNDIFKCIFLNESICIFIKLSVKFAPEGPTDNKLALFRVMAWCSTGNKPLPGPMMTNVLKQHMASLGQKELKDWGCFY